jgi:hypothetical protein
MAEWCLESDLWPDGCYRIVQLKGKISHPNSPASLDLRFILTGKEVIQD